MKPSNFTTFPYGSVKQNSESETIAANIMVILKRTGNEFRELSFDEYRIERQNDGNFTESERKYFDSVIGYCKTEETAKSFSPAWSS